MYMLQYENFVLWLKISSKIQNQMPSQGERCLLDALAAFPSR